MHTAFFLMAQYNAQAVIPIDIVVRDYFPHLSVDNFIRKVSVGAINIPLIRIEPGTQKSAKGVHVVDLANHIDACRDAAIKEMKRLADGRPSG